MWRKVLYNDYDESRRSGDDGDTAGEYPDTYIDTKTFLIGLVQNATSKRYNYLEIVAQSTIVAQQVSTVAAFTGVYVHLTNYSLTVGTLIAVDFVLLAIGTIITAMNDPHFDCSFRNLLCYCRPFGILFSGLYCLSPIISTLTASFSSDTIHTTSALLLILHLFSYRYAGYLQVQSDPTGMPPIFSAVATSAVIFACILLSSQLPTHVHTFGFLLYSVLTFVLFPVTRYYLRANQKSQSRSVLVSVLIFFCTVALLLPLSPVVTGAYILAILFICLCCPFWLMHIQKYKFEINGPWDEAIPHCHIY
ncbi:GlcNAc transferase [Pelomyxa schiedti]|nr:GlcNAc transferase [Pelomyxa schiedti]